MLSPETTLVSEDHTVTGTVMILVACAATQERGAIWAKAAADDPVYIHDSTLARICIDISGSFDYQEPRERRVW